MEARKQLPSTFGYDIVQVPKQKLPQVSEARGFHGVHDELAHPQPSRVSMSRRYDRSAASPPSS
jgi:hypothetical protein